MDDITCPPMYLRLAERRSRMEGFAYFHFPRSIGPATEELTGWVAEGSIVLPETVLDGIDHYPEALRRPSSPSVMIDPPPVAPAGSGGVGPRSSADSRVTR